MYPIIGGVNAGRQPIIPRSVVDPIGGSARIKKVTSAVDEALDNAEVWLLERFKAIPVNTIVVNGLYVNKNRYEYQISIPDLEQIIAELDVELDRVPDEYVVDEVELAYQHSTALAVTNLANISDDYTRTLTQVLFSDPYQRRVALIGARVFEEMDGFQGDTAVQLARVLRGAVQDGLNPLDVVGEISRRFDVSKSRAATIARTEITGALRRGRWDEAQDANDRLGIKTKLVWLSALSPTTRLNHALRHGLMYSVQEVREFYSKNGESINCKCAQTEMLVNDEGEAMTPRLILKLKKQKEEYFGD